MRTIEDFISNLKHLQSVTDMFQAAQENVSGLIENIPAPAINRLIRRAKRYSSKDLEVRDSIYIPLVNLPIRRLFFEYTGKLVNDSDVRDLYSTLLGVTNIATKATFISIIVSKLNQLNPNFIDDENFVSMTDEIFHLMLNGPGQFELKILSSNTELLSTMLEHAPSECEKYINLKNVQSLFLWFKSMKGNTLQIAEELPSVIELLFHFRPDNCWEIYKSLKGGNGNFVDSFTQENIFDRYIDLIASWGLDVPKLQAHYKAALRQLLEFHRFDDDHIKEMRKRGEQVDMEHRNSVSKCSLIDTFEKIKTLYPNAIGLLIPENIRFEGDKVISFDTPTVFNQDICTIVTTLQDIIQGKQYWSSHHKMFVKNEHTAFQAPMDEEGWNLMVMARLILQMMFEDNRLLGEYKYEKLTLIRKSFIEKHAKYLRLEEDESLAILSGDVDVPSIGKKIPFKMVVPDVKTKPSVLRKIFAKGVHITSMRDKLRCKFILPENLTLKEVEESTKHIIAYIFSIHGDTTMEEPRWTFRDIDPSELENMGNAHNKFSNPQVQSCKITVRYITDVVKKTIEFNRKERSDRIELETMNLKRSENSLREICAEVSKLVSIAGTESIISGITAKLKAEIQETRDRIAKLNLLENFDVNLDLHDEDSVSVEVQITRGPGPDDHVRYEYDMICEILKKNLPYYPRAVKESLDFLLFNTYVNSATAEQEKRYMWHVQLIIEYILDLQNTCDSIFENKDIAIKLQKILRRILNKESEMLSVLYYDDFERDIISFLCDIESHITLDN